MTAVLERPIELPPDDDDDGVLHFVVKRDDPYTLCGIPTKGGLYEEVSSRPVCPQCMRASLLIDLAEQIDQTR